MERLKRAALLTKLIESLRSKGSWAGETHIQKTAYFLQESLGVPFDYQFTLYWHGPFSFDLRDELSALRAEGLVKIEPQEPPYGPRYSDSEAAKMLQSLYPKTVQDFNTKIEFVTEHLGSKGVVLLEHFATGYFVTKKMPDASVSDRARELSRLKPHVSSDEAQSAIAEVDLIVEQAKSL